MKKFNSLKKYQYPSLWNEEVCEEKNQVFFEELLSLDCSMQCWFALLMSYGSHTCNLSCKCFECGLFVAFVLSVPYCVVLFFV